MQLMDSRVEVAGSKVVEIGDSGYCPETGTLDLCERVERGSVENCTQDGCHQLKAVVSSATG